MGFEGTTVANGADGDLAWRAVIFQADDRAPVLRLLINNQIHGGLTITDVRNHPASRWAICRVSHREFLFGELPAEARLVRAVVAPSPDIETLAVHVPAFPASAFFCMLLPPTVIVETAIALSKEEKVVAGAAVLTVPAGGGDGTFLLIARAAGD